MIINAEMQVIRDRSVMIEGCPVAVVYDPKHTFALGRYVCLECDQEVYHFIQNSFSHKGNSCEKTEGFIGRNIVYVMGDEEDITRHVEDSPFTGFDMKKVLEIARCHFLNHTKK